MIQGFKAPKQRLEKLVYREVICKRGVFLQLVHEASMYGSGLMITRKCLLWMKYFDRDESAVNNRALQWVRPTIPRCRCGALSSTFFAGRCPRPLFLPGDVPAPFFCARTPALRTFHSQTGDGGSSWTPTHLLIAGDQHFDCDLFSGSK